MQAIEPGLSAVIITLAERPDLRAAALQSLAERGDLELGELGGSWLPAVLTATDPYGAFRELEALPGVTLVEVVFVELAAASESPV